MSLLSLVTWTDQSGRTISVNYDSITLLATNIVPSANGPGIDVSVQNGSGVVQWSGTITNATVTLPGGIQLAVDLSGVKTTFHLNGLGGGGG